MTRPFEDIASWERVILPDKIDGLDARGFSDVVVSGKYLYYIPLSRGYDYEQFHGPFNLEKCSLCTDI